VTDETQTQPTPAQPAQAEIAEPAAGEPAAGDPAPAAQPETSLEDAEAAPAGEAPASAGEAPASAGEAPASAGEAPEDLDALVAKARERDEYLALAQRTQADFENYRRRMARENAAAGDRGVAKVARELLPALDHLELALKAAEEGHPEVVKGFAMVRDELAGALARVGIEGFAPEGAVFDPNEHEAMAQAPADGAEPGTVVEVYQRGYRLNGAVLRPARVVVAQ
jgi:molecular chaperone GrpE